MSSLFKRKDKEDQVKSKPCGQTGASHISSFSRQRACYSLPACLVISHSENKREVRAVKVRNATCQVRALRACVTETLAHTLSLSATQIHINKNHIKVHISLSIASKKLGSGVL